MTPTTSPDAKQPPALVARARTLVERVKGLKPVRVVLDYVEHRGPLLAAGMSSRAVFAVFAALWIAFSVFGIVVAARPQLQDALLLLIANAVPGLIDTGEGGAIRPDALLDASVLGWTGAVALVGLLVTTLGWLAAARNAVRVLGDLPSPPTSFLLLKLKDLGLALGFGTLLLISAGLLVLSSQLLDGILDALGIRDSTATTIAARTLSISLMFALDAVTLAALYRVLAEVPIPMRFLAPGALLGAGGLGVVKLLGTLLLGGATRNPLLASFAVIIGLLIWFTLISQVILIAACWVFVSMRDAGVPLDPRLAAERAQAEAAERERLKEELRTELAAERRPGLFARLFRRR